VRSGEVAQHEGPAHGAPSTVTSPSDPSRRSTSTANSGVGPSNRTRRPSRARYAATTRHEDTDGTDVRASSRMSSSVLPSDIIIDTTNRL